MLSLQIVAEANTDTSFPSISGKTSQASYTFSNFVFDINLGDIKYSSPAAPTVNVEWVSFDFVFTWHYHMCANEWPNPCQSGTIQTYTASNIRLLSSLNVAFDGPTVQISASSTAMEYSGEDIIVVVTCSDFICLIPLADISNAVGEAFYSTVTSGLTTAINNAAAKRFNTLPTSFALPKLGLNLIWTGAWDFMYPAASPNLVLYMAGEFTGNNKQGPPFSPDFAPPINTFRKPASQFDLIVTPYMLRSAVWGLAQDGRFDVTITSNEVPAKSPIQLNTNSPALKAAVPGFAEYPDMNVTIVLSLFNTSDVAISTSGVTVSSTANATFFILNSTFHRYAFDCLVDLSFVATMNASLVGSHTVQIEGALGDFASSVEVVDTAVGPVNSMILGSILKLALSFVPNPPSESFSVPAELTVAGVSFTPQNGWADVSLNAEYNPSVPGTQCNSGGTFCPVGNTCCEWGGEWGCCTLPDAVCCSAGCCANGCSCDGEYCSC
eukprot:TRINITY_DN933_c0_g2_i1.p1 TRINITY_DN933_c0_g2~~TRINITY_DN933_c0_g2_i1.p1  ORF type:complete len:554 (-),score=116.41 TRINITY_DN933_c0_g2_i1:231-1715(-)